MTCYTCVWQKLLALILAQFVKKQGGAVPQQVERWTCDQQIVGSNSTWGKAA